MADWPTVRPLYSILKIIRDILQEELPLWINDRYVREFRNYFVYILIIAISGSWSAYMWSRGWCENSTISGECGEIKSLTWHIAYELDGAFVGPTGTIFVILPGFLFGLSLIAIFDKYKSPQALILLTGSVATWVVTRFVDRFRVELTSLSIGVAAVTVLIGLGVGYMLGEKDDDGFSRYKKSLNLFRWCVLAVALWGFVEAHVSYRPPYTRADGWIGIGSLSPALEFTPEPLLLGLVVAVVDVVAIVGLWFGLREFVDYESEENVVVVGPDRAGKTWFMAALGESLRRQAAAGDLAISPFIDDTRTEDLVDDFANGEFDSELLQPTDEPRIYGLAYEHGKYWRKKNHIYTVDYKGELIGEDKFNVEEAGDGSGIVGRLRSEIGLESGNDDQDRFNKSIEKIRKIEERKLEVELESLAKIVSQMTSHADIICLILPMDSFVHNVEVADLRSHVTYKGILDKSKIIDRRIEKSEYLSIYKKIMGDRRDAKILFVATMSDYVHETREERDNFRKFVWETIIESCGGPEDFPPNMEMDAADHVPDGERPGPVYPVHLEPDEDEPWSEDGEFRPKVETDEDDEKHVLKGTEELLEELKK